MTLLPRPHQRRLASPLIPPAEETAEVPSGENQMLVLMAMPIPVNDALPVASRKWLVVLADRQGRG